MVRFLLLLLLYPIFSVVGLPRTVIELLGIPSSGKSTFSYMVCGQAQEELKKEWEDEVAELEGMSNPKAKDKERLEYLKERGAQKVAYLDSEFSSDEDWMTKNGVDVSELIFIAPENQTAEQLFQILLDIIASDGVGAVVLDSIPALVSKQAMEKSMEDKTMAGISGPLSVFSSKLMPLVNKYHCLFIGINQLRDDMSGYHQIISPGGKMWKHTCSIRMIFRRGSYYDSSYKDEKAHPDEAYGNYTEVEVLKNKATKPDRKMCKFSITYDDGIDGYNDTFNMAVGMGIITKTGAWYNIMDEATGEPRMDDRGEKLKWQGKANAMAYLKDPTNADVYEEVHSKVEEAVVQD